MPAPVILKTTNNDLVEVAKIGDDWHLIVENHAAVEGNWKSVTHTTNQTSTVVTPPDGYAITLTDLLVSGERINGGIITIQFNDGTNQEIINKSHVTDNSVNLAMPFNGRWRGWKNAYLEFITDTANQDATVSIGYYFVNGGTQALEYNDWNTQRDFRQ